MSDKLDAFVNELQASIYESVEQDWGEAILKRWQDPLYMGEIPNANGHAVLRGSCGDQMEIFLRFAEGRVQEASFRTDGCGPSVVCGSHAAELAQGKLPEELLDLTGDTILDILGGLPDDHVHCAHLAIATLHAAVDDYMGHSGKSGDS